MKFLVSLVGPTASGKTALAVELALRWGTSVISADSRQIYRGMDIGTAKPTQEEQQGVRHFCLDELNPGEPCTAAWFGRRVASILEEEFRTHDVVIMAGGSGLYCHVVWKGVDEIPEVPAEVRAQLLLELQQKGLATLAEEVSRVDPLSYQGTDLSNPQRVVRVLEVYRHTGIPISTFRRGGVPPLQGVRHIIIGLEWEREALYARINARVEQMMAQGLLQEVVALRDRYGEDCPALNTIGYRELIFQQKGITQPDDYPIFWPATAGSRPPTVQDAVAMIQQNTRRFAKRQLTWFRKYPEIHWMPPTDVELVAAHITQEREAAHGQQA